MVIEEENKLDDQLKEEKYYASLPQCPYCGCVNSDLYEFCTNCGNKVREPSAGFKPDMLWVFARPFGMRIAMIAGNTDFYDNEDEDIDAYEDLIHEVFKVN